MAFHMPYEQRQTTKKLQKLQGVYTYKLNFLHQFFSIKDIVKFI